MLNQQGNAVQIGDLVQITKIIKDKTIYRKNQKRIVLVLADLAGRLEGPFYAMMDISGKLKSIKLPKGYELKEMYNGQPEFEGICSSLVGSRILKYHSSCLQRFHYH